MTEKQKKAYKLLVKINEKVKEIKRDIGNNMINHYTIGYIKHINNDMQELNEIVAELRG